MGLWDPMIEHNIDLTIGVDRVDWEFVSYADVCDWGDLFYRRQPKKS